MTECVVLSVPALTCPKCAAAIERSVAALDGVDNVHVDLARREVTIWRQPGPGFVPRIVAAINEEGYEVSPP